MIKAEIDQSKLERSLKRFGKQLGETNAQAVIRWSVQVCRELAMETQVWGKVKTKQYQIKAMRNDAYNVLFVASKMIKAERRPGYYTIKNNKFLYFPPERVLKSASEVNDWIEVNRTRRGSRTAKLAFENKKVCSQAHFNKAMAARNKKAGMAKGAWLGAGNDIARAQVGSEKENIGRNFLSYTQKHQKWGDAKKPADGWKPVAGITSKLAYSGKSNVLARSAMTKAIKFGLRKTVKFYAKTLAANDKKDKP